jgi:arginine decarboxylase
LKTDDYYRIKKWSNGYFQKSENGELLVSPFKDKPGQSVSLHDIVEEIKDNGIQLPVVLRFQDILHSQIKELNEAFIKVIKSAEYNGRYTGVYPIKVNQLREVVEEISYAGEKYDFGLEAGSKAELISVLSMDTTKDSLIILNGFKDEDFLKLALVGRTLEKNFIVVIEKFNELRSLIKLAKEMEVEPLIGFRARISTKGSGRWAESGGEGAKFGLTTSEIIKGIELLKENNMLSTLRLLHFHVGSQITNIQTVKDAVTEASRIYCGMKKLDAPMGYLDVGGGLGVDYDGSRSLNESSVNYDLDIYASNIIWEVKEVCDIEGVEHPNIVTETGRALTAHHSCIISEVFDSIDVFDPNYEVPLKKKPHTLVKNMLDSLNSLREENTRENFSDALSTKQRSTEAFMLGVLGLEEKSVLETLFWQLCRKIHNEGFAKLLTFEDKEWLETNLASQYLCNFSIFQSLPDTWGVGQLIPIVPLSRLNEDPTVDTTLCDITCDSDGKIKQFICEEDFNKTLKLHKFKENESYYVGFFLTGAYQDVMGDIHNLYGRLNELHIFLDEEDQSGFYIEEIIKGATCESVLRSMQYLPEQMASHVKRKLDRLVIDKKLPARKAVKLTDFYEECLASYTYLSTKKDNKTN